MLYIKILNTNFVTIYATIFTFLLHYCQLLEKHPCHNDTDVFLMVYYFLKNSSKTKGKKVIVNCLFCTYAKLNSSKTTYTSYILCSRFCTYAKLNNSKTSNT
jgi:hypothetical protein